MPKGVYERTWEHRIAIIAAMKEFIGIPLSEERRQKISDSRRKKMDMVK